MVYRNRTARKNAFYVHAQKVFSGKNIICVYGAATRKEAEDEVKRMNDMHKRNGVYYWDAIA